MGRDTNFANPCDVLAIGLKHRNSFLWCHRGPCHKLELPGLHLPVKVLLGNLGVTCLSQFNPLSLSVKLIEEHAGHTIVHQNDFEVKPKSMQPLTPSLHQLTSGGAAGQTHSCPAHSSIQSCQNTCCHPSNHSRKQATLNVLQNQSAPKDQCIEQCSGSKLDCNLCMSFWSVMRG